MKTKTDYLSAIAEAEAMQAKYGSITSKLNKEYCALFARFKRGDEVTVTKKSGRKHIGRIWQVSHKTHIFGSTHGGTDEREFSYQVQTETSAITRSITRLIHIHEGDNISARHPFDKNN